MAENENKLEEVVEQTVEQTEEKVEAKVVETPTRSNALKEDDTVYKVDLNKPPVQEETTEEKVEEPVEEVKEEAEAPIIQEVTDEEEQELPPIEEEVEEEIKDTTPAVELPENISKVVDFMNETGGTLEDYVRLNADYSNVDDEALLREYYKSTKPHLNYDEEVDEPRDVKRKKLAYKEAVAQAKNHLENMKSQYYQEVKLGSRLTQEQQKAIDFFNRYNDEQAQVNELTAKQ